MIRQASRTSDYSHLIIGGGAIGLAIGARMSLLASNSVLLVEKHSELGTETSSRNSEVIHAGIYHPPNSLRTKLCIRGKHLLYEVGEKYGVEMRKCGKWIVAQDDSQYKFLEQMYNRSKEIGVRLEWVSLDRAKQLEPAVIAKAGILHSPTTGILSAHSLMTYLEGVMQSNGADISLDTVVTGIEYRGNSNGYLVTCQSGAEPVTIRADNIINSAGLYAPNVSNMLLPKDRHVQAYYAKGNYYSYTSSKPAVSRLIYPCPSDFGSLGTHLTIDLAGRIRFGPDFEWVDRPDDLAVNGKNLDRAIEDIRNYVDLDPEHLVPDYAGIRPKIVNTTKFQDFVIRQEPGFPGFINLLNMESPGLTASMAIAEYVENLLL